MAIGVALLVSPDPVTIDHFSHVLDEFSISQEVCGEVPAAIRLLNHRKFDAVIVDLQIGEQSGALFEELHISPANRTAVTFAISASNEESSAVRKRSEFVFERPLSTQSIRSVLKPAYGLILREQRRYFRCPISISVSVLRPSQAEVRCDSVNISEGGMAVSTTAALDPGEKVDIWFTLPEYSFSFVAESTICWRKSGYLGIRFVSLPPDHKSELQDWLARKLEESLPEAVAGKFRKETSGQEN